MVNSVIGLVLFLLGLLGYNIVKRKSAEALLQNLDTKSKLNDQDKNIASDKGQLDAEEIKRKELEEETKSKESNDNSISDITDFFNKH